MKRLICFVLALTTLLTACSKTNRDGQTPDDAMVDPYAEILQFNSLDDEFLHEHIEDLVYKETVSALNSKEYFVENVSSIYISKEYLEEISYNSQSNLYFGYSLAELDELFQGRRYIFTLADDGQTMVQEYQELENNTTETMLKNIAIGTGVILVCVTVSVVSAGVGAPAVSMIFAASATTAKTFAISSAAFGGISAGIVKGIQTGDFEEAVKAAGMGATEGFKWGAISGAIVGGSSEAFLLKTATKNGLTMNDAALIQVDSNYPIDVIAEMHSYDEYLVYKNAGLKSMMVNGKTMLVPDIDLNYVSALPDGTEVTNLERMRRGLHALEPATGKAYEIHHIHQNPNGTLAILTQGQHRGNAKILNTVWENSPVDHGTEWVKTTKEVWKGLYNSFANGGI